ncbi:hypothetical protein C7M84_025117 [Penaeus vannamei]|uniref:Uncharacterized protein n=1 Tax=Penaeus vannamei TaxID=6689 RepID=A0A423TZ37_PENVA|nr:hypothetical protein C7M84_025117 [Penaeus vannamei]
MKTSRAEKYLRFHRNHLDTLIDRSDTSQNSCISVLSGSYFIGRIDGIGFFSFYLIYFLSLFCFLVSIFFLFRPHWFTIFSSLFLSSPVPVFPLFIYPFLFPPFLTPLSSSSLLLLFCIFFFPFPSSSLLYSPSPHASSPSFYPSFPPPLFLQPLPPTASPFPQSGCPLSLSLHSLSPPSLYFLYPFPSILCITFTLSPSPAITSSLHPLLSLTPSFLHPLPTLSPSFLHPFPTLSPSFPHPLTSLTSPSSLSLPSPSPSHPLSLLSPSPPHPLSLLSPPPPSPSTPNSPPPPAQPLAARRVRADNRFISKSRLRTRRRDPKSLLTAIQPSAQTRLFTLRLRCLPECSVSSICVAGLFTWGVPRAWIWCCVDYPGVPTKANSQLLHPRLPLPDRLGPRPPAHGQPGRLSDALSDVEALRPPEPASARVQHLINVSTTNHRWL